MIQAGLYICVVNSVVVFYSKVILLSFLIILGKKINNEINIKFEISN